MIRKIAKGERFGDWKLQRFLGEGGNGFVWLALNSKGEKGAIKLLAKMDGKDKARVYARFRSEVSVVRANSDVDGLLLIIDNNLPDDITEQIPWYVMPVAQTLDEYVKGKNFEVAVRIISHIGTTLIELHRRGISHRDIKPANILIKDGKVCLADFGLVDYPDKTDVTSSGEQIGAKWTIAPEVNYHAAERRGFGLHAHCGSE